MSVFDQLFSFEAVESSEELVCSLVEVDSDRVRARQHNGAVQSI